MSKTKKLTYISILIITSVFYILSVLDCLDTDMWFMITNGRDILNQGILFRNPHTIVDLHLINQQWLYCIILALVDKIGYFGFVFFVAIQNVILILVSIKYLNMHINSKKRAFLYSYVAIVLCFAYMINIRPQIVTMVLLIWQLIIMEKAEKEPKKLFWIIPIILLESNLHGSVLAYHILLFVPFMAKNNKFRKEYILSALAVIPLGMINPYTYRIWTYTFKAFLDNAFNYYTIGELVPISPFNFLSFVAFIVLVLFVCSVYLKKLNFKLIWYVFFIAILSFHKARNLTLIFFALIYVIPYVDQFLLNVYKKFDKRQIVAFNLIASIILALCIPIIYNNNVDYTEKYRFGQTKYLLNQVEDKNSKIFTDFDCGGFAQYLGFTNVFIDNRPEIYTDKGVLQDAFMLQSGVRDKYRHIPISAEEIKALVKKYDFDYLVGKQADAVFRIAEQNPNEFEFIDSKDGFSLYKVKEWY